MDPFELPADLTTLTRAELEALRTAAETEFDEVSARTKADGTTISQKDLDHLRSLNTAAEQITTQISTVESADAERQAAAQELIDARAARVATPTEPEPNPDDNPDDGNGGGAAPAAADVVTEAEQIAADAVTPEPAVTAATTPPSFKGLGRRTGSTPARNAPAPTEVGFEMRRQVPKFVGGHVGFREIAASIQSMTTGSRVHANRAPHRDRGHMVPLSLATLDRGFGPEHQINADSGEELERRMTELVARTEWRPSEFDNDSGALVASGGHCAVPETIYTFCDVTPASGLLTLPAANFGPRGGIRRPLDPDFTELYNTLPFRYTEEELTATNPDGTAVVTKPCIEIPCTEWEEIQVDAIGLCVTAGILQKRGFPEEIERFLKEVTKAHLIKVSIWSILDMIAVSNPYTIPSIGGGAAGAFLNGLALRATLIRQQENLPHDALVEGESPAWVLEVAKADMAIQQGREVKAITDQEIDGWLTTKNIRVQWLQHWQKLPTGSVRWPTSVQVLLHPAGAFVQHLENVIEVGTLYDKAMLQKNRYMELFTEDEYAVDKRCKVSEIITVPLCANGSYGAPETITCAATVNEVQALTITGSPTDGTFTVTFKGKTTTAIAYNATAAVVQAALAALSTIGAGNVAVSGSAGGPWAVTFQGVLGATNQPQMTATGSLTGGTSPAITPSTTTPGAPN